MSKFTFFAPLCLVPLSLTACTHSTSEGEPPAGDSAATTVAKADPGEPAAEAKTDDPPPAADAPAAEAVSKELNFSPEDAKTLDDGRLEVCLDCNRQSATYNYCRFDKAAFESAIGTDNLDKNLTVRVSMVRTGSENSSPDDPNMPQPEGGFNHHHHDCSIEEVLSVD